MDERHGEENNEGETQTIIFMRRWRTLEEDPASEDEILDTPK
jgi:hypothetical protein